MNTPVDVLGSSGTAKYFGPNIKTNPSFYSGSFSTPNNFKSGPVSRGSNQYMKFGSSASSSMSTEVASMKMSQTKYGASGSVL